VFRDGLAEEAGELKFGIGQEGVAYAASGPLVERVHGHVGMIGCSAPMYSSQAPVRDLYDAICANDRDCFATTLMPWLERHRHERDWLAMVGAEDQQRWQPSAEELCRLYAFSRVNDLVLLGFQPAPLPGVWCGPSLSLDQYREFLTHLGIRIVERSLFHPFYHEVVAVQPNEDPDAPVEVVHAIWPCSMIGGLLFSRAWSFVRACGRWFLRLQRARPCTGRTVAPTDRS